MKSLHLSAALLIALLVLTGCGLTPEVQQQRDAALQKCRDAGGTAYTAYGNYLEKCAGPKEQARLERLELACVESGGTPKYHYTGFYENCRRASQSAGSANNSSFKPYCPPSKYPIYGCPSPTPVIIVDD